MQTNIDCTKCRCWIRPFEPSIPCFECCTAKLLLYTKPPELQQYFDIPAELSEKIFEITSTDKFNVLSDFKPFLTDYEFEILSLKLKSISEEGWNWIQTVLKEKIEAEELVPA
jgi:hypothetical protein